MSVTWIVVSMVITFAFAFLLGLIAGNIAREIEDRHRRKCERKEDK